MSPSGKLVEGEAKEVYLLSLPFFVLRPLMEYRPDNSYWEPLAQLKVLEYWMRTPLCSIDPNYAKQIQWYGKKENDSQIRGLAKERQSGNYFFGASNRSERSSFCPDRCICGILDTNRTTSDRTCRFCYIPSWTAKESSVFDISTRNRTMCVIF